MVAPYNNNLYPNTKAYRSEIHFNNARSLQIPYLRYLINKEKEIMYP
jgi:hypothetical protein